MKSVGTSEPERLGGCAETTALCQLLRCESAFCKTLRDHPLLNAVHEHFLPAEDAEDEVEHEEGSDDDEGDEVDDVEGVAHRVVELQGGHYL